MSRRRFMSLRGLLLALLRRDVAQAALDGAEGCVRDRAAPARRLGPRCSRRRAGWPAAPVSDHQPTPPESRTVVAGGFGVRCPGGGARRRIRRALCPSDPLKLAARA
ncbi:unnamed protein product [Pedinophyceae sp. YPF-701]|nr:unnamed protein product [Pedinophyceae sp. YPF-701]